MDNVPAFNTAAARRVRVPVIRHPQDFWSGWFFLIVGGGFSGLANQYPIGSASRMGAGFLPLILGALLALFGLLTMMTSLSRRERVRAPLSWRPEKVVWILGAATVFALLLEPAGLAVSLLLLVIISSKASDRFTLMGTLANAAVLIALNVALFIWGLDQLIPVWPALLSH